MPIVTGRARARLTSRLIAVVVAAMTLAFTPTPIVAAGGTTERVSVDNAGSQANSASTSPSISADGRYVAFTSDASNLVPGDANRSRDVFVHDRLSGTTERISVDP